jgi:hypothetical protein
MIKIAITAEAFDAIAAMLASGNVLYEREGATIFSSLWEHRPKPDNLIRYRQSYALDGVLTYLSGATSPLSGTTSEPYSLEYAVIDFPSLFKKIEERPSLAVCGSIVGASINSRVPSSLRR